MKKLNWSVLGPTLGILAVCGTASCTDDKMDDEPTSKEAKEEESSAPNKPSKNQGSCTCPKHDLVEEVDEQTCELVGGEVTEDLHLVAGCDYFLKKKLAIGDDGNQNAELKIDPGVTIYGADKSFIQINRGSTINAEGTAKLPIVMTSASATRETGDWGGLVINGKATTNNGKDVQGEADSGLYGGNDDDDNSGTLRYLRVEFAGNLVDDQNELNGIAFQGVGSGTTVEYIQVHAASDDGIEFFGGTVSAKHVLITNASDDSIDWTGGWRGNIQFLAVQQWDGAGDRGIEADNNGDDNTALPMANPTISNATIWSNQTAEATGALFREGTAGAFHNFAIGGFPNGCLSIDQDATSANVASGELVIVNSMIDSACSPSFNEKLSGTVVQDWFETGDGNSVENVLNLVDPKNEDAPDLTPKSGSALLGAGVVPDGAFFEDVDYVGAFDKGDQWATGWTAFPNE